eukprot:2847045-Rhodomonas_salina.2
MRLLGAGKQKTQTLQTESGISLRVCYVMPGTDLAYESGISLCACYAMPGTDLVHVARQWMVRSQVASALSCYALAMQCPVRHRLHATMVLCDVRYWHRRY